MTMLRLLLPALLLTGCYADELRQEMSQEPFFDLAGYMQEQVDSLTAAGTTVEKTITLNGTTETHELSNLNFGNDLRVFREADINKPAWLDKYDVQREEANGQLTRTYTALDSSLQTRQLTVTTRDDRPVEISIRRHTGTVLSDGDHHLTYSPRSGYRIRSEQVNRFGEDLNADITVRW